MSENFSVKSILSEYGMGENVHAELKIRVDYALPDINEEGDVWTTPGIYKNYKITIISSNVDDELVLRAQTNSTMTVSPEGSININGHLFIINPNAPSLPVEPAGPVEDLSRSRFGAAGAETGTNLHWAGGVEVFNGYHKTPDSDHMINTGGYNSVIQNHVYPLSHGGVGKRGKIKKNKNKRKNRKSYKKTNKKIHKYKTR